MYAIRNASITGIVFVLGVLKSFFFLRIDLDAQHSGFVYAQSIAFSNGLLPNKNFFSPYGVVGPAINGLWLKLTTDSLLSLLLLYGLITVLTGYLIQRNTSRYVGGPIGILLNITWVFIMATTIPWPSVLSTFLCLVSFTILIENTQRFKSHTKVSNWFLIPVVIALHLAVFTRIQLIFAPVAISLYLICKRKDLNWTTVRFWFLTNFISGSIILTTLTVLGILNPFIEQVIHWPLTEFGHPAFDLSWWASLVWFPLSLLLLISITYLGLIIFEYKNKFNIIVFALVISSVFFMFYIISITEFSDARTNTLRTFPGFIKNASINFQFIVCYSSAMIFLVGSGYRLLFTRRNLYTKIHEFFELNHFIILVIGFTGLSQLYPLRDNVHLWFVSPFLIISASYYFGRVQKKRILINKSLTLVLSCLLLIEFVALGRYVLIDREPLKSYELRGLISNSKLQFGIDDSMALLGDNLNGRVLRNNCIDSLFSVSNGKYVSIDGNFSSNSFGNFTDNVPVVDPNLSQPTFIFECRISVSRIQEILGEGSSIVFQYPELTNDQTTESSFNVLFKKRLY
jgi:hypothetical protein